MTLILASVSWAGVLQVTDRLVTQSIGGRNLPFDPASNKNLVFIARNGVADDRVHRAEFLDAGKRVHTDQWIAETIIGRSLSDGPEGQPAMLQGGGGHGWPDLGQAIDRIQRRLPEALAALPSSWRRQPPTVTVAGWMHYRRRRKWSRPFGFEIHHIQGLGYTRAMARSSDVEGWLHRYVPVRASNRGRVEAARCRCPRTRPSPHRTGVPRTDPTRRCPAALGGGRGLYADYRRAAPA